MPIRRFLLALAASLALHLALLGLGLPQGKVSPRNTASISARLLPPAIVRPSESLLKDTLSEQDSPKAVQTPPQPEDAKSRRPAPRTQEEAARRKASTVVFYPPEAWAQGLEGEVRLLLTLDGNGAIQDVQVAAGSGHAILDDAAVQHAWRMGSLPGAEAREVILPVVFRLR